MKRSTVAAIVAAGTAAAAAAAVPYFYRQSTKLGASHYVFRSPKVRGPMEGFRITQVSDLHNKEFGSGNRRLLALVEAQLPDIIVITGDLVDSYHTDLDKAAEAAGQLARIAPCYFVTGNHEHRMSARRLEEFCGRLEEAGVILLRDRAVTLGMGEGFRLIGVDCSQARTDTLTELMKDRPAEELNVLLSHKPHYAKYYEKAGVDLVLTGHAHGGQWRFPGVGGVYAPGQGILPKYTAGMYRLGETVMCVSRGLGNSSFPLRIENKPELVTVILREEKK